MDELSYEACQAALCCINNRTPYTIYKWLLDHIVRRLQKGKPVTVEYLACCSSMKKLSKASFDECKGCVKMTKEARHEFEWWCARYIIEKAKSEIEIENA